MALKEMVSDGSWAGLFVCKKSKNQTKPLFQQPCGCCHAKYPFGTAGKCGVQGQCPKLFLLPISGCGIDPGWCWHPNSLWEGVWSHGRGAMSSPALTPLLSLPTAVLSDYESAEDSEVRVTPDSHGISAQTHLVSLDPFPLSPEELISPTPSPWHWDQCH